MRAIKPSAPEGTTRSALYRAAKAGSWERIARGIYLPADAPPMDWDQIEAATRRPDATICLLSALAHHDLTDVIPDALDMAIPRGARKPATQGSIRWHHFDKDTFELGREETAIAGSEQMIGVYSPERTLADCFRLRSSIGYEVARDATKEWLRRGGKPAKLMQIARQLPRAKSSVLTALEMLA